MNTTKLFFMAALVVIFAACSNDDDELIQQPAKMITITAQLAPKSESASTRAVSESGDNIVVDWAENEQLKIISANGYDDATATITDVDGSGVATILFTISETAKDKDCTIIYPYNAAVTKKNGVYTANPILSQNGTLNASLDVRIGKGHITNEATPTLDVTTQPVAQFAIFKFTIKNAAGDANVDVKPFNINIGAQTYVITPTSPTTTLYAALPDVSNRKFYFFATGSDNKTYIFSKANVSFDKGYYYKSTLKMTTVDGLFPGIFTINDSGGKVYFSHGNLQATYNSSTWTWAFAANQWDYIGAATANTTINGNRSVSVAGTVDLFGWSTSTTYGIYNSTTASDYSGDFFDWGNTIGGGWRTLTLAERGYLFNTRIGSTVNGTSPSRYTLATIRTNLSGGVNGVILFPDGQTFASSEFTTLGPINDTSTSNWGTKCTDTQWDALAAKGCVFLPAAGYRNGTTVINAGTHGYYWSSEKYGDTGASGLSFEKELNANASSNDNRYYGYSVRLVYDAN